MHVSPREWVPDFVACNATKSGGFLQLAVVQPAILRHSVASGGLAPEPGVWYDADVGEADHAKGTRPACQQKARNQRAGDDE
jgi:hypothetical protein